MEIDCSSNNTQYYCAICNTTPDQKSHHKAHLKTQKHIYKKKCFEQCVNMCVFYFNNLQKMPKQDVIKKFEEETNTKFVYGVKESHDNIRDWVLDNINSSDSMLKSEFPKVVIHPAEKDVVGTPDFLENWLEKILETNETMVIKHVKNNKNIKNDNFFKEYINNQTVENLIIKAIEVQSEFDIAVVFFKLLSEKYSFKSFVGNVWIDKYNLSLSIKEVSTNLRNEITTTLKDAFENYSKNLNTETEQYKSCLKLIEKLNKTIFKNNLIRESRELFFNN